jgi:hypothetical protein
MVVGMPKTISYTNWMMTSFDAADLMPDMHKETMNDQFRNKPFYVSLSALHVSLYRSTKCITYDHSLLE